MRPRILPPHYDKSPGVALFSAAVISPSIRTSWRDVALMFVVWCLIGGFELTHPREVHAQVSGLTDGSSSLSFADRKVGVVNQLRGLNQSLREIRLRIDPKLPLRDEELTQLLHEASLGQLMGQSLELSFRSIHALQRRDVSALSAYPQLLMTLSESLLGINLSREGLARLRRILKKAKSTPSNYERAMIALFERGRGSLSADEQVAHWGRYLELCRTLGRPPSPAAHYVFAKSLYFAGAYPRAERELRRVIQAQGYQARSIYILAVLKLIDEDWDAAFKLFSDLKAQIDTYLQSLKSKSRGVRSPSVKLIAKRPRVRVTAIIEEEPARGRAPKASLKLKPDALRARAGLSEDLRALLDEINAEERLSRVMPRRLGAAPAAEDVLSLKDLQEILAMALARVSLLRGDLAQAWQYYRAVPEGSPRYHEALLEAAYLFKVRREYLRCAETLSLALKAYPNNQAALELRLWRAEMLGRARQTTNVKRLYREMKRNLTRQVELLEGSAQAKVLFAPDVLAWLPPETKLRSQRLSKQLRELEIWLGQARRDLTALQSVSEAGRYPMIELGSKQVDHTLKQLKRLTERLPRLRERWRAVSNPREGSVIEVNLGAEINQRAFEEVSASAISEATTQLRQRALRVREELKRRESVYRARLAERLNAEARLIKVAEQKLSRLRAQITQLSESGRLLALKRVRGFQAQLELGPILSSFWLKENATEQLDRARERSLSDARPLKDLQAQESQLPRSLDVLDILDPVIKSYIVDPLPDPERDRN